MAAAGLRRSVCRDAKGVGFQDINFELRSSTFEVSPMLPSRRRFLQAAGAGAAAAGFAEWIGCSRRQSSTGTLEGAPGVEVLPPGTALPDYSHDLEAYL